MQVSYGAHPDCRFDLLVPPGADGALPTVALIHGGFWRAHYTSDLLVPLVDTLTGSGLAVANLEYRRVGAGGGWPATLLDVAAALDALARRPEVDPSRIGIAGHSAGGHLALWTAGRHLRPPDAPGADPVCRPAAVVSLAGVTDLVAAARQGLGSGAVTAFLGGAPGDCPERYRLASPIEWVPVGVAVLVVHGDADAAVPLGQSRAFAERALAAGDAVELREVTGDHFVLTDPGSAAWLGTRDWLASRLASAA